VSNAPQEFLLVYSGRDGDSPWWTRPLHRELAHVDVWQPFEMQGFYLVTSPLHDYLTVQLVEREPTGVVQHVYAQRAQGIAMWPVGLKTCVTVAKAMLGIRDARVWTPRQLHNYIERRNGIV
jgi:hypothetical protein